MDMTNGVVLLFTIALVFITVVISKATRGILFDPKCNRPRPPKVKGVSIIRVIHTLLSKGLHAMIHDQYTKLGSPFTISFFNFKLTFLIGPEVSAHFYQGLDSEISLANAEFTVAMFGKEVFYGLDTATRNEQARFLYDAMKPSKTRSHAGPIIEEVGDYFAKRGQEGMVDLKQELDKLFMLIAARYLLGKEVRENMFDEFFTLFLELTDNGTCFTSVLFPYAPTPANRRRDRARAKLSDMLTGIVRSRKRHVNIECDVLQNLIDSKYSDGRSTTEEEVIGMIIFSIFAGKHTSTISSVWTGVHLLACERSLKSVLEEQNKIVRKYGDHLDYSAFQELHKGYTITKDGIEYDIHKGYTIVSPLLFNGKLPHIYKDPDVFDPDRFGPGREEDKVGGKFSYTSFGAGRHVCVGETFGYLQIKVIWSYLLRNFELKLQSPFPEPNWTKMFPEPTEKVIMSYKRRVLPTM